jgi:hypothetical protein
MGHFAERKMPSGISFPLRSKTVAVAFWCDEKKPMRPKLVSWVSGLPDPETVTLALIALCPHIAHKRENQNVWRLR